MENVIKTGYLKKGAQSGRISSVFRRMPRRWFVYGVRDGVLPFLEYYENEESTFTSAPINSFDLTGCQRITYVLSNRNPNFTFCIVLSDRVIELTALTRSDLIDWCDRMERSLRQLGFLDVVRGPDDDHVYVDAPFLQRRKKPAASDTADDGVIHSSVQEVPNPQSTGAGEPEDVPGMVFVPTVTRQRPLTIGSYPSSQSSVSASQGNRRRSLERQSSLDSFLVEEKDNSCVRPPSKGLVRRSTIAVPIRKTDQGTAAVAKIDRTSFELDTQGSQLSSVGDDVKPNSAEVAEGSYGHLSEWTSVVQTGHYSPVHSPSTDAGQGSPVCKMDENDNQTGMSSSWDLGLKTDTCSQSSVTDTSTGGKALPVAAPLLPDTPTSPSSPSPDISTSTVGSPVSPLSSSLNKCLPDDEQVQANVRELLRYFEGSESEYDDWSGATSPGLGTPPGYNLYPRLVNGTSPANPAAADSPVWESLSDMAISAQHPDALHGVEAPKIPISSPSSAAPSTALTAQSPSPDMGYISDQSPSGVEGHDPAMAYSELRLPTRSISMDQKEDAEDSPPPLPNRPSNLPRPRPQTLNVNLSECAGAGAPPIPARRCLSTMQQVSTQGQAQSVVPLKMSQVELFREHILSPVARPVELRRRDCLGMIAFVDAFGSVWVAGWNQRARPRLHGHLHIGDRLISINNEPMTSAAAAQKFIKNCLNENLVLEIKTAPKAKVVCIRRSVPGQSLGFKRDGGTAEIIYIDPNGLAAQHGLSTRAPTIDSSGFCNWVLTEINSRPLNLFLRKDEVALMLDAVGLDISLVVQPVDFVGALKRQLKHVKSYKDYLLP